MLIENPNEVRQVFDIVSNRRINKFLHNGELLSKGDMRCLLHPSIDRTEFFATVETVKSDELKAPVEPIDMPTPHWDEFLKSLEIDTERLRLAMQQAVNGEPSQNLVTGPTASGKTMLSNVLSGLLGGNVSVAWYLHELTESRPKHQRYFADSKLIFVYDITPHRQARHAKVVQRIKDDGLATPLWIEAEQKADWANCIELHRSFAGFEDHDLGANLKTELPGIRQWIA